MSGLSDLTILRGSLRNQCDGPQARWFSPPFFDPILLDDTMRTPNVGHLDQVDVI